MLAEVQGVLVFKGWWISQVHRFTGNSVFIYIRFMIAFFIFQEYKELKSSQVAHESIIMENTEIIAELEDEVRRLEVKISETEKKKDRFLKVRVEILCYHKWRTYIDTDIYLRNHF